MTIFNIQKKQIILQMPAGLEQVYDMQWSKKSNDLRFASVTTRGLQFWHPADASKKLFKSGTFGQKYQQTRFYCCAFNEEGLCFSGGENGLIYCWDQRGEIGLTLTAHSGQVTAITCSQGMLISSGKDCKLTIHSIDKGKFKYLSQVQTDVQQPANSLDYLDGKVLIGHVNSRIATFDLENQTFQLHNLSHHSGEVWGLEILPTKSAFLTCGDDNEFHEVSIAKKTVLRTGKIWTERINGSINSALALNSSQDESKMKKGHQGRGKCTASSQSNLPIHQQGRAIAYSPHLNHVAVGNNYGCVMIYEYSDFQVLVQNLTDPQEWCEVLKYSPNGAYLAAGSHDNSIYIYHADAKDKMPPGQQPYQLFQVIKDRHSAAILALDWTTDSVFLRSIDASYMKNYFDIGSNNQIMDGAHTLTDASLWQSSTCKLGWDVMGVYWKGSDGTDVNAVDTDQDRKLVAVADDQGTLCIYRYPCFSNGQDCLKLTGHSEHVTRARFFETGNQKYIISAGGKDLTYIQWKKC